MNVEELEQLLTLGHETRSFEVKGPGDFTNKEYVGKVARAVMAMGNSSGGGLVCLGIDEDTQAAMQPGLNEEQYRAWAKYDDVVDRLSGHSDPALDFTVHPVVLSSGARVVVLNVPEFADVPYICKRPAGNGRTEVLKRGALYVRPGGKPRSVPVPSSNDMRDLIDRAVNSGVRRFLHTAEASGFDLKGQNPRTEDPYQKVNECWAASGSSFLGQLQGAGHMTASLVPEVDSGTEFPSGYLERLLTENVVRLRGWPLPFIDNDGPRRYQGFLAQDLEPIKVPLAEAWRFTSGGAFSQKRVLSDDLEPETRGWSLQGSDMVKIPDVLLYLIEIVVFASRLASSLDAPRVSFRFSLENISGRRLETGTWKRELDREYTFQGVSLHREESLEIEELFSDPVGRGIEVAQKIFAGFGANLSAAVLRDWQAQYLSGSAR